MERAAVEFLDTLHPAQKGRALFEWKDEERLRWSFLPGERPGLQLGDLEDAQRAQLTRLMQASLSSAGYLKSEGVLILEAVLKELQPHAGRDPGKYVVTVFGIPGKGMWGWSLEGHHLSLNFTSDSRGTRSSTPLFFGVAPAVVESGSHKGLRLLGAEVDLAYALIQTLSPGEAEKARLPAKRPREVVMKPGNSKKIGHGGLSVAEMDPGSQRAFWDLLTEYPGNLSRLYDDAACKQWKSALPDEVFFSWAGDVDGGPLYYRLTAHSSSIEYASIGDDAQHAHVVWRDLERDFGKSLRED